MDPNMFDDMGKAIGALAAVLIVVCLIVGFLAGRFL